jgi:hypothetical protein
MTKVVFAAALTGPVGAQAGAAAVDSLTLELDTGRVLTDHAVCYPPPAEPPSAVLEPLYPDRLAEDFLALTVPGHPADYPAQGWATRVANTPACPVRLGKHVRQMIPARIGELVVNHFGNAYGRAEASQLFRRARSRTVTRAD